MYTILFALIRVAFAAPYSDISPRIVGGQNATRGQFPYQISLQACSEPLSCRHVCGGTIVSQTAIVTAAHCLPSYELSTLRIVAGILNLNDSNAERQEVQAAKYIIHPKYDISSQLSQANDIAIVFLNSSLKYSAQVQPAKLPSQGFYPSGKGILSGWGSITLSVNRPVFPNTLKTVTVPVIPKIKTCYNELVRILGTALSLDLNGGNVCTQSPEGVSACLGDSGSPLFSNNVFTGIVSWGIVPCGVVAAPNIFTNVGGYVDWLSSLIPDLA